MKYDVTIVLRTTYWADSPDDAIHEIRAGLDVAGMGYGSIIATGATPSDDQTEEATS